MQHSEWSSPTQEEVREFGYAQLDENNGNGKGGGNANTSVPVNGGAVAVLFFVLIYGIWKQSRTSRRSTSES